MKQYTQEEIDALTERARAWASSEEGQRQLRETNEATAKIIAEFEESCRIPWQMLHEPVTI